MLQEPSYNISVVQNSLSNTLLKDGESVFVRVVEQNKDGSYTASFAGNRFIVRSLSPLTIGSSFKARLTLENSSLKLIPLADNPPIPSFSQTEAGFLSRIGLIPDAVSLRMMQFFQQLNIKINLPLAQKARSISSAFPGKEKEAAEAFLFLSDRGIEGTEELISLLLRYAHSGTVLNKKEEEILSYINHKKGANRHWVILPFSDLNNPAHTASKTCSLEGVVKILINTELKKTEKLVIECDTAVKKYFFVLQLYSFSNIQTKKVLSYCTLPGLTNGETRFFSEQLKKMLGDDIADEVQYDQSLVEDGIFCRNLELSFFQGSV